MKPHSNIFSTGISTQTKQVTLKPVSPQQQRTYNTHPQGSQNRFQPPPPPHTHTHTNNTSQYAAKTETRDHGVQHFYTTTTYQFISTKYQTPQMSKEYAYEENYIKC